MPVRFAKEALKEDVKRKYHNIILSSFKAVQMVLAIACIVDHVIMIYTQYQSSPHVVIFCGTYFGFSVISAGLLYEYLVGDRNPNHLEIFFCAVGGILSSTCNNLTMYIAKDNVYIHKSKNDTIKVDKSYFELAKIQSIVSMVTGVSYYVDLFINLDIWMSNRRKKKEGRPEDMFDNTTVIITVMGERGGGEEDEEEERRRGSEMDLMVTNLFVRPEDELQLHAFCFEFKDWFIPWKEDFKNIFKRRKKKVRKPVTEVDFDQFISLVRAYRATVEENLSIPETITANSENSEENLVQQVQLEPPRENKQENVRGTNRQQEIRRENPREADRESIRESRRQTIHTTK